MRFPGGGDAGCSFRLQERYCFKHFVKKLFLPAVILSVLGYLWYSGEFAESTRSSQTRPFARDAVFAGLFQDRTSGVFVEGEGAVIKILPDDASGRPHQRFIVRLSSKQTILIAHNIELAPRIPALKIGDSVEFRGEYEWNPQGGVVHWTHHDPKGGARRGWIKHSGRVYE